uniref:Salivary lipocalin n=1 Tax=Triatoma matogrossensis TaxID=162370 RepID=E2J731_9HEMI
MKRIIVVFCFGVVTNALVRNQSIVEQCRQEKPVSNFKYPDFFKGPWFVTQAKNISTSVCHDFYTSINSDGIINITADGYYDIGDRRDFYNVICTGPQKVQSGTFSLTCQPKRPDAQTKNPIIVSVDVTVMEKDYNKYAVVYRCATSGSVKTDNYLVLQRNKDEEIKGLDKILNSKGITGKLISRKQTTYICKHEKDV